MRTIAQNKGIDIRTIRRLISEGKTVAQIAEELNCSKQAIYQKLKAADKHRSNEPIKLGIGTTAIDPETGMMVKVVNGGKQKILARMGDEKVSRFVEYHIEMLAMRQGVNKRDVRDLYNRFVRYIEYCRDNGIIPNNMNCYYAIGITRDDISKWKSGSLGTPEHKEFASMVSSFFASIHEQGAIDGVLNPISSIFWQKAHDGLSDQPKIEVQLNDPLGDKRSAEDIAKAYGEVELPD